MLSSIKANSKYVNKHKYNKTKKHLYKRISNRSLSTYKQKQKQYKNKNKNNNNNNNNNKFTRKHYNYNISGGALNVALQKYLEPIPVIKDKAIIVIGGYGGTISRTLLNELNKDGIDKTYKIFYFARPAEDVKKMTEEDLILLINKTGFISCNLNTEDGLSEFEENLNAILTKYTKTFIINCAADKDSSIVIKNYKEGKATYSRKHYKTEDTSTNNSFSTLNLSIEKPTDDWHWTMHVAKSLAELCNKYTDKIHLIHLSTVYVNKGDFFKGESKWCNDYVNYDATKDYSSIIINDTDTNRDPLGKLRIPDKHNPSSNTTFYNIDLEHVSFNVDKYDQSMKKVKPPIMNLYLYGLIKGLTEQIIKKHSGLHNNFVIIRLPVIMNEELTRLEETSPSLVIKNVLDKLKILSQTTLEPTGNILEFDYKHKRYPLTAQYVSKYIIKKIFNKSIDKLKQWNGIKSICNKEEITKSDIATNFLKEIEQDKILTIKPISAQTPYLPFSEVMERDSTLDDDEDMKNDLNPGNIMKSILKGYNYFLQKEKELQ